ncbi:hypothetical protein [Streptomyces sp. NPDC048172]|uniref:hypothetical protein n=1 Tax=Streptomyces sp. NPDC048172 TaxID=3365505 RepID=UPI00371083AF
MKYDLLQILGMVLFAVGAQGAIRLLIDSGDTGLLGPLPGGFAAALVVYVLVAAAAAVLAGRAHDRAKALGRRK